MKKRSLLPPSGISHSGKVVSIDPIGFLRDSVLTRLGFFDLDDFDDTGKYIPPDLSNPNIQEQLVLPLGARAVKSKKEFETDDNSVKDFNYNIRVIKLTETGYIVEIEGRLAEISVKEVFLFNYKVKSMINVNKIQRVVDLINTDLKNHYRDSKKIQDFVELRLAILDLTNGLEDCYLCSLDNNLNLITDLKKLDAGNFQCCLDNMRGKYLSCSIAMELRDVNSNAKKEDCKHWKLAKNFYK